MTINDQIRDEKLQYVVNREASKISALSSINIQKYEYLTGGDILPCHQQQVEQRKLTHSPLGQAFEKQIKTIKYREEKQVKAIQDQAQLKTIKKFGYYVEDTPFISKQKEIFNELVDERREKVIDLDKKVNSDDLIYGYKGSTTDLNFNQFNNALDIINKIRDGKIDLADVKDNQERFKSYLGELRKGNKYIDQTFKKYFVQYSNALQSKKGNY